MNAFAYLPTLAWCVLILAGSAWLGYRIVIDALDNYVRGAEPELPEQSWACAADCVCREDLDAA